MLKTLKRQRKALKSKAFGQIQLASQQEVPQPSGRENLYFSAFFFVFSRFSAFFSIFHCFFNIFSIFSIFGQTQPAGQQEVPQPLPEG